MVHLDKMKSFWVTSLILIFLLGVRSILSATYVDSSKWEQREKDKHNLGKKTLSLQYLAFEL